MDLDNLTDDGDTIDLDDGRKLRLRIGPDDIDPFAEYDCYGKLADADGRRSWNGYAPRPDGFDGNAEKLHVGGTVWWWQPPEDVKRSDEHFASFRRAILDLIEYGLFYVCLEVLDGTDAYGSPIVTAVSGLGGVDSDGVADVLPDLVSDLDLD